MLLIERKNNLMNPIFSGSTQYDILLMLFKQTMEIEKHFIIGIAIWVPNLLIAGNFSMILMNEHNQKNIKKNDKKMSIFIILFFNNCFVEIV